MVKKKCKICKIEIKGRSDKMFCSTKCRSTYHNKLKAATLSVTDRVDKILHRNRSILLELVGKNVKKKTITKADLDRKRFSYSYCTGVYTNAQGKMYYNVYDFAYMLFSDGKVLIVRRHT